MRTRNHQQIRALASFCMRQRTIAIEVDGPCSNGINCDTFFDGSAWLRGKEACWSTHRHRVTVRMIRVSVPTGAGLNSSTSKWSVSRITSGRFGATRAGGARQMRYLSEASWASDGHDVGAARKDIRIQCPAPTRCAPAFTCNGLFLAARHHPGPCCHNGFTRPTKEDRGTLRVVQKETNRLARAFDTVLGFLLNLSRAVGEVRPPAFGWVETE